MAPNEIGMGGINKYRDKYENIWLDLESSASLIRYSTTELSRLISTVDPPNPNSHMHHLQCFHYIAFKHSLHQCTCKCMGTKTSSIPEKQVFHDLFNIWTSQDGTIYYSINVHY